MSTNRLPAQFAVGEIWTNFGGYLRVTEVGPDFVRGETSTDGVRFNSWITFKPSECIFAFDAVRCFPGNSKPAT